MSNIELPLVPSARSSHSSASSRSHLHSAGSITSEKSARSVRSQRNQENQEDDGNSTQSGEEDDHEEPQESSGAGIWDEVEHFLNKPSPSLSKLSVKSVKTSHNPPKSTLPTLIVRRGSPDNQTSCSSRPARGIAASTGAKKIDPKLLQEAFAYAQQLQQVNFDEDDNGDDQQQSWRSSKTKMLMQRAAMTRTNSSTSSSSSGNAVPSGPRPGRVKAAKTPNGSGKKKGKTTSTSVYSSSAKPTVALKKKRSTSEEAGNDTKSKAKGHMDPQTLQALVSNFQQGTTLDELRRELEASQQSMAVSRQLLQEAAQSFFHSH